MANLAYAMQPAPGGGAGGKKGNPLGGFLPLILIFVIFYFFLIRPQQKRAKEQKNMVNNLKQGDSVVTSGGIYGKVVGFKGEAMLHLEIAENTNITVARDSVAALMKPEIDMKK